MSDATETLALAHTWFLDHPPVGVNWPGMALILGLTAFWIGMLRMVAG